MIDLDDFLASMNTFAIGGTVVAASPISHGDGTLGTTTTVRRMRVVQPDGSVQDVPIVSGNGVRGRLRRVSGEMLWREASRPRLSAAQHAQLLRDPQSQSEHLLTSGEFRTIYQGGSLTKAQKRMASTQVTRIRELLPHMSLFGWSGGGRIVEGRSKVSALIPLCDETAHILDATVAGSFWERLDVMEFSRMEDTIRSTRANQIAVGLGENLDDDTDQMRFATQVIAAGTPMAWAIKAEDATSLEAAWVRVLLTRWALDDATVGGRSAAGLGKLKLDGLTGDWRASQDDADMIGDHFSSNKDEIQEAITWLG